MEKVVYIRANMVNNNLLMVTVFTSLVNKNLSLVNIKTGLVIIISREYTIHKRVVSSDKNIRFIDYTNILIDHRHTTVDYFTNNIDQTSLFTDQTIFNCDRSIRSVEHIPTLAHRTVLIDDRTPEHDDHTLIFELKIQDEIIRQHFFEIREISL